jgi:hypothetical protein
MAEAILVCALTILARMSHLVHYIPRVLSTQNVDKVVESHESQHCRYVPFTDGVPLLVLNKTRPHLQLCNWSNTVHLSMSSTTIPFSTCFVSIARLF